MPLHCPVKQINRATLGLFVATSLNTLPEAQRQDALI